MWVLLAKDCHQNEFSVSPFGADCAAIYIAMSPRASILEICVNGTSTYIPLINFSSRAARITVGHLLCPDKE